MCLDTLEDELKIAYADLEKAAARLRKNSQGFTKKKDQDAWAEWQVCAFAVEQLKRDIKLVTDLERHS